MSLNPVWNDQSVIALGRELMHAPWGAYPDAQSARAGTAESPWSLSLDGRWAFLLAANPESAPAEFFGERFDDGKWAQITVPGNWELQGFGEAIYCNIAYPFMPDPPRAPKENPTGCYRRIFDLPATFQGRRIFLEFGSVDSAFHVWVNGVEVGYGTDSKLPSSFEITDIVKSGRNMIAVRVYRWGAGAYLEKQDYWHLSGIQRSVRLIAKPGAHLRDWFAQTRFDAAYRDAELIARAWMSLPPGKPSLIDSGMIDYAECRNWSVSFSLLDPGGNVVGEASAPVASRTPMYGPGAQGDHEEAFSAIAKLAVPSAMKWSAETPVLYTLVMELRDPSGKAVDWERQRVGLRQVEMKNNIVHLNGRRLVVRGVNRHEFHPRRGRAVTLDDMREDIIAMKRLNFNAVRTCHYPDDRRWYNLCDELGMYIVDEANLETHGIEALATRDPVWASAYLERVVRMVLRDRNHACIYSWSLGNEAHYGPNHAAMAAWARMADATRTVQYEGGYPPSAVSDILSCMYPDLNWVRREMTRQDEHRPLIMVEYAYAKGNSNGNVRKFWDLVWEQPRFQGGFVWDWRDKALESDLPGGGVRWDYGKRKYEPAHVERMCLNGVVGPDLAPHPGAFEIKMQQAPVYVWANDDELRSCRINVHNRYQFLDLAHLKMEWAVLERGAKIAAGETELPAMAPDGRAAVSLPIGKELPAAEGERSLVVRFRQRAATAWCEAGHEVYAAQFRLRVEMDSFSGLSAARLGRLALPNTSDAGGGAKPPAEPSTVAMPSIAVSQSASSLECAGQGWSVAFDRKKGALVSMMRDGRELLAGPALPCFYRAPTDIDWATGDGGYATCWHKAGLDRLVEKIESMEAAKLSDGQVRIQVNSVLGAEGATTMIRRQAVWTVFGSGDVVVDELAEVDADVPTIPRVGLSVAIAGAFDRVKWFGRGPHENYPDRKESAFVGLYESRAGEMLTPYVFPQECGLRCDTRWAAFTDAKGAGLLAQGLPTFHFSALPVRLEDLRNAGNLADLKRRDEISLHFDGHHMGLGGDTGWSQNVHEEYRLPPGQYRWRLRLRSLAAGENPEEVRGT